MSDCSVGDLVHIPQAVELIDCRMPEHPHAQLTIPLRVFSTTKPEVAIITAVHQGGLYCRVFCEGNYWVVKGDSVYFLRGKTND